MKIRTKKKLLYKFLGFFLPFIIISITITGLVLSATSFNFFQKTVTQDYQNIIKSSAGEIRLFMENARNNLESLALVIAAAGLDRWQEKMALTGFLHSNPQFVSLTLYSLDKEAVVTTVLAGDTPPPVPDELLFDQAVAGRIIMSGVRVSGQDMPMVHMAIPIRRQGVTREVLWAELNLKSIWDVLSGISVGRSGQVYILDVSGRTIGHRQIDRVIKATPPENPAIVNSLRTASGPVEWIENNNGQEYYNLGVYVPGLDWIVVLSQPRREIFSYLYRNIWWAALLTLGLCAMAAVFGWRWVRRLLSPIHRLHDQVRAIGGGELNGKVTIDSEDEIGDLGRAFNDMTDSLKAYIEREVETARALMHAQNLAVLGTTSSKVTHEVGNFLNNIDMAMSGLKSEPLTPRGEKILQIVYRESGRVKAFIQRFLQFARKPDLRLQKRPLAPIIREVMDVYRPLATQQGVTIDLDWPETLPPVNVDAGMLGQVLNNLIKNSLDAISGPGTISIGGAAGPRELTISVTDSGAGMEESVRARIFEPFYTTKGAGGTGLGMAIVKTIVESHRGVIECHSTVGQGTTFVIRLPLY
ncbi:MAG: sensor histidine kinase [Thermodesulfobacteriota bacterium]